MYFSELGKLKPEKDIRPGHRGTLAVNIVNDVKYKAKQRKKEWRLTDVEAFVLITSPCHYCGFTPEWPKNKVGIDRIDNLFGYTPGNCVSCCFTCNSAKGRLTYEEFKAWVDKIYKRLFIVVG